MKTRKVKRAVAILYPDKSLGKNNKTKGVVRFTEKGDKIIINYKIENVKPGYHGFHIHEFGDLTEGCKTAGAHFNTYKRNIHGGPRAKIKHNGDLGNVKTKTRTNIGRKTIKNKVLSLKPCNKNSIIGRSIIIHKNRDDLGLGHDAESKKTGNAGKRLACGVIGLAK